MTIQNTNQRVVSENEKCVFSERVRVEPAAADVALLQRALLPALVGRTRRHARGQGER